MDRYEMINHVINELNKLTVQGIQNMNIVLECVAKLAGLRDGMKKADAETEQKIETLKNSLKALQEEKENGEV